jgi:hypothetical protein
MLNKIKYTTLGFILGAILFMGLGFIYANSNAEEILAHFNNIKITVNGERISLPDAQPFIDENGRTQVPVRFVSEALGADVGWDGNTKTVTVEQARNKISLVVGKSEYTVNSKKMEMDTSVIIVEDRTFVPARYVAEALGAEVDWDSKTKTVIINSKNNIKLEKDESFTEPENFIQMLPEGKPKQTVDGITIYYFNEAGEYDNNGMPYVNLSSVRERYNLSTEPNTNKGIDLYYKVILIKDLEIKLIDYDDRMTLEYYMNNIYPLTKGD